MPLNERVLVLDGLRGFAVLAVLFYHLDLPNFFYGGFIGVDLFFVISGFLISSLLKREFLANGNISLFDFYGRRIVRLFPSVLVLIAITLVYCFIFAKDVLKGTTLDSLFALLYLHNWWQIISQQSYFEAIGRPLPLQHLWSLAIEEQFYLFFPLVLRFFFPRIRLSVCAVFVLLLALFSGVWSLFVSLASNLPESGQTSRVYFGTDTHSVGLLMGAACGIWRGEQFLNKSAGEFFKPVSFFKSAFYRYSPIIALGFFLVLCQLRLEATYFYFYGGSILISFILCALVITSCLSTGVYRKVMQSRVILWSGTRSYALYLWHWPIFCFIRPGFEVEDPWVAQLLRISLTAVFAEISFRFLESAPRNFFSDSSLRTRSRFLLNLGYTTIGIIFFALYLKVTVAEYSTDQMLGILTSVEHSREIGTRNTNGKRDQEICESATQLDAKTLDILFYGDSVLLGATPNIVKVFNSATVRAMVGKQGNEGIKEYYEKLDDEPPHRVLVLHFGTNGFISENIFDQYLKKLDYLKLIILINVNLPKRWEEENNAVLARLAEKHPNIEVLDWKKLSSNTASLLAEDRIHATPVGGKLLIAEIIKILQSKKILNVEIQESKGKGCN